jgi:hypothetical protein
VLDAWTELYSNSAVWRTVILYAHIAGLLVGGGCAIAADRLTLTSPPDDPLPLRALAGVHPWVIGSLGVMVVSGLLMLAANVETYLVSAVFWTKMLLVVFLLMNGLRLVRAEQAARRGEPAGWRRLRGASLTSLTLWLLIALLGATLPNV